MCFQFYMLFCMVAVTNLQSHQWYRKVPFLQVLSSTYCLQIFDDGHSDRREVMVCGCLVIQLCPTLCDSMDCSPPSGSPVHEIFLAGTLKWVAISYSRGSSWLGDRTRISCIFCIGRWFFTAVPPGSVGKALVSLICTSQILSDTEEPYMCGVF